MAETWAEYMERMSSRIRIPDPPPEVPDCAECRSHIAKEIASLEVNVDSPDRSTGAYQGCIRSGIALCSIHGRRASD